jgi:hypothetical protein
VIFEVTGWRPLWAVSLFQLGSADEDQDLDCGDQ